MPEKQLEWKRARRRRSRVTAERIEDRRASLGLSQEKLAEAMTAAGFRMTQATVSRAETGAGVDEAELIAFAAVLRCSTSYLLGLTGNPDKWTPDGSMKEATRAKPNGHPALTVHNGSGTGAKGPRQLPIVVAR